MLKIKKQISALPFANGESAFKAPFGYGKVGKSYNSFAYDYYLFPFNYFVRLKRWLEGTHKKGVSPKTK